jgi:hypothetical protein
MREAVVGAMVSLLEAAAVSPAASATLLAQMAPLFGADAARAPVEPAHYRAEDLALALAVAAALRRGGAAPECLKAALLFPPFLRPPVPPTSAAAAVGGASRAGRAAYSLGLPPLLATADALDALTEPLKLATATFPRLHLAWDLLLDALSVPGGDSGNGGGGGLGLVVAAGAGVEAAAQLWQGEVGKSLLGGSHNTKGTALLLLPALATRLGPDHVAKVGP